jgi:hypothetical protein
LRLRWSELAWWALPAASAIKGLGAGLSCANLLLLRFSWLAVEAGETGGSAARKVALHSWLAVEAVRVGEWNTSASSSTLLRSGVVLCVVGSQQRRGSGLLVALVSFLEELPSDVLSAVRSAIPPDSMAVGLPLHRCSDFVRQVSLCYAPSGPSPAASLQAVLGAAIDLEMEEGVGLDRVPLPMIGSSLRNCRPLL